MIRKTLKHAKREMQDTEAVKALREWLTDDRLGRLNHIRTQASLPVTTRDAAAKHMATQPQNMLDAIKEKIG